MGGRFSFYLLFVPSCVVESALFVGGPFYLAVSHFSMLCRRRNYAAGLLDFHPPVPMKPSSEPKAPRKAGYLMRHDLCLRDYGVMSEEWYK
jgi:hypothetical protein